MENYQEGIMYIAKIGIGVQGPLRLGRSRRLTEFKKSFIHGSKLNKIHRCRKLRQYYFTVNYDQI